MTGHPQKGLRLQRAAEARALRDQGLLIQGIADRLGISRTYASSLLLDPDGSGDAARKKRYGGVCLECGAPTDGSNGRVGAPIYCHRCHATVNAKWSHELIVQAIQRYAAEYGHQPVSQHWLGGKTGTKPPWAPYTPTVLWWFGTWRAAMRAAGFDTKVGAKIRKGHKMPTSSFQQRVRELLAPLESDRDALIDRKQALVTELRAVDADLNEITHLLGGTRTSVRAAPGEARDRAIAAIRETGGAFTVREIAAQAGVSEAAAGKALTSPNGEVAKVAEPTYEGGGGRTAAKYVYVRSSVTA